MTDIVVAVTPTVIVAAADSLELDVNTFAPNPIPRDKLIRLSDHAFCAYSGRGGIYAFEFRKELQAAYTVATKSISRAADCFIEAMKADYMMQLKDYIHDDRKTVIKARRENNLLPEIVFAGFENGAAFASRIYFELIGDDSDPNSWSLIPIAEHFDSKTELTKFFFLGVRDAAIAKVTELISKNPIAYSLRDISIAAVQTQIIATPNLVGPPIRTITISKPN